MHHQLVVYLLVEALAPTSNNTSIEFITISTTGNATDFGDLVTW